MSNVLALPIVIVNFLILGVICLGIPWAFFTLARTRRTTDEILTAQREILRELRRARNPAQADAESRDGGTNLPTQPFW